MKTKMRNILLRLPVMLLAFFLAGMAAAQSKIYYVSSRATDTGDGSSWANATTLTKALDKGCGRRPDLGAGL